MTDIILEIKEKIQKALSKLGNEVDLNDIVVENSKDPSHGDYATNCAMKFSRCFSTNPNDLAHKIIETIDHDIFEKIEIAGPGFINFYLKKDSIQSIIKTIISLGFNYGKGTNKNQRINVEFVSANPTGDLHVGHARGAAIGDSICRILSFAGYDVEREYYINDAGCQIQHLGESLFARYKELCGEKATLPENGYHGQDVIDIAKQIKLEIGDSGLTMDNALHYFMDRGKELELKKIVNDLNLFRVEFDTFSSELVIRENDAIDKELNFLKPYSYLEDGAVVLKTSQFLDDKDRVIVKSNGEYTYFLPDIVYHVNKMERKFDKLIDILGADHHGYINRMKSALMMHGYDENVLDINLIQMVRIMKDGKEIVASKRTGNAYTLRELCDDVGVDAARYFFAMRASSSHLDFDMDLAVEKSSSNPVYYAQYAHARLSTLIESAKDIAIDENGTRLVHQSEIDLMKHLQQFPLIVEEAADEKAPYKIANYIHSCAELIHTFYTQCRVIDYDDKTTSASRLALCKASMIVLKNALNLIGVNAPDHM